MPELKQKLIEGVESITGKKITWTENLFGNAVDSMSLVEIINLVEKLAEENSVTVDFDALISEDVLTLDDIYQALLPK